MINDVTVIIRSIGERTEELCRLLILEQGVPEENVVLVNERPFSRAMKVSYQTGIDRGLPWTFCVDADVLLSENALSKLLEAAKSGGDDFLGLSGSLLDKFFGIKRTAGNHLFRTRHLQRMIDEILPYEEESIRPESSVIKKLKKEGLEFKKNAAFIGLHDFEQDYKDIARKAFTHSVKHAEYLSEFVSFWKQKADDDLDYKVALYGASRGMLFQGRLKIDVNVFETVHEEVLNQFGKKGSEIPVFKIRNCDDVLKTMENSANYFNNDDNLDERYEKIFRQRIKEKKYSALLKHVAGRFLWSFKR